jgi:hypothetical protein
MVVVPLSKPVNSPDVTPRGGAASSVNWVTIAAAGSLATGAALIACGKPRAGLITAASGTALAMLDHQETVRTWWNQLPVYLAEVQGVLGRVQTALDDISAQRERLHKLFEKPRPISGV